MADTPRLSATGKSLLKAVQAIARANHYMVGFDRGWVATISFDDFSDVHRALVDMENATPAYGPRAAYLNRCFGVLATECKRQHNTEP